MAEASNATESRLSSFIQGCSQLQEIYAVAPLTYTNIVGEWWQRINDIIYALGLTETESTVVNIAWTVPAIGRKRSPFFEEELTTKQPNGDVVDDVDEEDRISHVAGDGTGQLKAHKYGLIQSVDALFQRNIDTWGGLYDYFYNQQHEDGSKPLDLTEMIFGNKDISTEAGGPITDLYNDATRNLTGNNKGLANSLKHIIEDIFGADYYDWLDSLSDIEDEPRPNGLQEFFFGDGNDFSDIWGRMTTGGLASESVKIIDTIGLPFYEWLNNQEAPASIQQFFFGNEDDFNSVWDRLTTDGLATETVKVIDTLGEEFYDWLNNPGKLCNVASTSKVYHLYKRTNGNWARINASVEYTYKGKCEVRYTLPAPTYNDSEMRYSTTMNQATMFYADNSSALVDISTIYGNNSINTTEKALKHEFVNYAINGTTTLQSPISALVPSPSARDVVYAGIRLLINSGTSDEYEVTKVGLFVYSGTTWSLIEDTYGTFIPGVYEDAAYSAPAPTTAAERRVVKTCLVEVEKEDIDTTDHSPKSLMELLFGPNAENTLCDVWKDVSTGSIIQENLLVKEAIGQDLLDLVNGDPICVADGGTKAGPHSLKEMLFGSMSTDEICKSLKQLSGDSLFSEVHNITNYLGDSYYNYVTNNTYNQSSQAEAPEDPTINPLKVLATMDRGQVLYGAGKNKNNEYTYKPDYIVETGYICDTMQEAMDTINSLTDQERIFNTYQRVAYTGTGTPFTPGTTDQSVSDSTTSYYYNTTIPFKTFADFKALVNGTASWPDPTDSTKRQYVNLNAKTTGNTALTTPSLQIYNTCESLWYALLEETLGTESCPNVKNGATVSTVTMVCPRSNPDWTPSFWADRVIKKWNQPVKVNGVIQNRRVYAISNWSFKTTAAWKLKHDGVVAYNSSTQSYVLYQAGDTVPAGTTVYASVIIFVEREPNDAGVIEEYSNNKLSKVTFTKYRFTSYQYFWNVAVLPRWYNNNYYPNNEYRNHFVYIKRDLFARSPSFLSGLGIQEQVYSNGNPTDSSSWVYDASKELIFLGCNSVAWTGFVSNKKFSNFHFETSPNADTDDDDGTGIIVGGYKDNETGIVHTLSLTRTYSSETSFEFCIDRGYNGKQVFNINATANTFNNNPNLKVRHLNGRYGGYFKEGTSDFVPVTYNGTNNYIVCDPKTVGSTSPDGYYETPYAIDKVGSIYNATKTVYRDTYINTGPSGGWDINFKKGNDVVWSGSTYTRTKNGRKKLDETTNEETTTEATSDWLNVKKTIQAVLEIVNAGGLVFSRTPCAADKDLGKTENVGGTNVTVSNVLDVQHVIPFHLSGTDYGTWWDSIGIATQNGIINSIRYIYRKGNDNLLTTAEVQTVLQKIYSKYTLSTFNVNLLTVDDLFKLYQAGARMYAGDPSKDCFVSANVTQLGFIQGYGYLNAYAKANLNSKYIVDRSPGSLTIVYKDLFHAVNRNNSGDPGIQYLWDKHKYRGDIIINFETTDDNVVNLTVTQGSTTVHATSKASAASSTVKYLANLADPRLLKMLNEPTGYGYTGCSNPLSNFTDNKFLDLNTSTVYDLDTNHIWEIDQVSNTYSETQSDATAAIYRKYGPGKLISNDMSEKLYYTRGDSDMVQKLVDGTIGGTSSGGGSTANLSSYYNIIKNDILNEVNKELYGSAGREADVDADGNDIPGEASTDGLIGVVRQEISNRIDARVSQLSSELADGKTISATNENKIQVDFTNAEVAQKLAFNTALNDLDSGFSIDPDTGKLQVDFTQMPTDKFEALLSALKMQIPLEENLNLYVDVNDANADDEIVSGRGTAALPFKSIEACIRYATQKYAIGANDVVIRVKEGNYYFSDTLYLSDYTHTNGAFYIVSEDGYGKAIINNSAPQMNLFELHGGAWHFIGMKFNLVTTTPIDGIPHHPACIVTLYGSDVFIDSCQFIARYDGEARETPVSIRGIAIDLQSNLYINCNNLGPTTFEVNIGNGSINAENSAIYLSQNSHLYFPGTNIPEENNAYKILFAGNMKQVLFLAASSSAAFFGGYLYYIDFGIIPGKTLNAVSYTILESSHYHSNNRVLPGREGYVEESAFCWKR